ncbi:hypothetical protein SLOPH_2411 [Spraguea lophii 42_110]|uniref:Uncharacterized protein n=1 Tax=Spraguea lophii (strain 42_110) TaxID=1358809 RepID=S7XQK0_SPRLO|nr:hypothetical protein SLOPH_2411 [Spraguea lophii 42_110]
MENNDINKIITNNKMNRINELLNNIDKKINILNNLNQKREEFNFKLKSLLFSIDCYKIQSDNTDFIEKKEEINKDYKTNRDIKDYKMNKDIKDYKINKKIINNHNTEKILNNDDTEKISKPIKNEKKKIYNNSEELYFSIENSLPSNMLFRLSARKIIDYLYISLTNQNYLLNNLNKIIKESGVSKYRVIEILQLLVKMEILEKKILEDRESIYILKI